MLHLRLFHDETVRMVLRLYALVRDSRIAVCDLVRGSSVPIREVAEASGPGFRKGPSLYYSLVHILVDDQETTFYSYGLAPDFVPLPRGLGSVSPSHLPGECLLGENLDNVSP